MTVEYTAKFLKNYTDAPRAVQKSCDKQLLFLMNDLRHPSLHAKKYNEVQDIWQARVNDGWRLYFVIENEVYTLISMTPHPK
ncbi:MAG: hypothetical protein Q8P56_06825 [Candidatus Uhrbacteria bacterium]|nr:hypothetical protein [Candidatus Uhrbacteria bacterium]